MNSAAQPDPRPEGAVGEDGHFGEFGGQFVPETLMGPIAELAEAFDVCRRDPDFERELDLLLRDFVGRETMHSVRFCWREAWARPASSPRPAPGSTGLPPRRRVRDSG